MTAAHQWFLNVVDNFHHSPSLSPVQHATTPSNIAYIGALLHWSAHICLDAAIEYVRIPTIPS
jgi:hypothetical protein